MVAKHGISVSKCSRRAISKSDFTNCNHFAESSAVHLSQQEVLVATALAFELQPCYASRHKSSNPLKNSRKSYPILRRRSIRSFDIFQQSKSELPTIVIRTYREIYCLAEQLDANRWRCVSQIVPLLPHCPRVLESQSLWTEISTTLMRVYLPENFILRVLFDYIIVLSHLFSICIWFVFIQIYLFHFQNQRYSGFDKIER